MPGIKGVWKMAGGGPRFINVIAIEQQHAGHAKMAGLVAAGCGSNAYLGRIVIVVDDDIDITNSAEVMWALATRWDPKTQTDIIDGCWTGYIDPTLQPERREAHDLTNSRIIIYAVRPFALEGRVPQGQHGLGRIRRRGARTSGRASCSSWRDCRGSDNAFQVHLILSAVAHLSAVVPAKAGTQYSRARVVLRERISSVSDYWVPAFARTTAG